ncbi:hypothetical protein LCGC14_1493280 [marine sediment metagenome]|uniref:Uncharacterized protein n=1 Tax=marine sediment metagenome TaxID=412755 RepID=A0A0F9M7Q7_9ZZZZ
MSIDVMTVGPCSGIERGSEEFIDWLDTAVDDFSIRYCSLQPTQENIDKLREFADANEPGATMILAEMGDPQEEDDADGVELFIG